MSPRRMRIHGWRAERRVPIQFWPDDPKTLAPHHYVDCEREPQEQAKVLAYLDACYEAPYLRLKLSGRGGLFGRKETLLIVAATGRSLSAIRQAATSTPMTSTPLIVIPPERQELELVRARVAAESASAERRRFVKIVALCYIWGLLGVALIGLSLHLTGFDRPQVALLGGILLLIGGPSWTLILSHWLETQGR